MKKLICCFLFVVLAISLTVQAANYREFDVRKLAVGSSVGAELAASGIPNLQVALQQNLGITIAFEALKAGLETRKPLIVDAGERGYLVTLVKIPVLRIERAIDPDVKLVGDLVDARYRSVKTGEGFEILDANSIVHVQTTIVRLK